MSREAGTAASPVASDLLEEGRVLRLTLGPTPEHPKGNVLTGLAMEEISHALEAHRSAAGLRLVLLRGAGAHFSFGAAVEEHRRDEVRRMLATFHRLVRQVAAFPVPVAALVQGQCLGGGLELVLVCHLVFATPDARFAVPEIRLGVFPPVFAVLGAERLGAATAERLVLTGDALPAPRAAELGWLTALLPAEGDPEEALLDWYRDKLAPLSGFALRQATRALRTASGKLTALDAALDAAERLYLDEVVPSHDGNEGIEAFLERRSPDWRDR